MPGLPAKPVIDIDVAVADPTREDLYVPALEALGYELRVRSRPGTSTAACNWPRRA